MAPCDNCDLYESATNIVDGAGPTDAKIMMIGEAPGEEEDKQGLPFVGRGGKVLDKALGFIGVDRDSIYITNLVKCRPPENRNPAPSEIKECKDTLIDEVFSVRPKIIITLGKIPSSFIAGNDIKISELHGSKEQMIIISSEYPDIKENTLKANGHVFLPLASIGKRNPLSPVHSFIWVPLYHPAWLLHGYTEAKLNVYREGLLTVKELLEDEAKAQCEE